MNIQISPSTYDELKPLSAMKTERVAFTDDGKSVYYKATVNGELVGCVGYMVMKNGSVRYKTDYVKPEFRGNGIHTKLFAAREKACQDYSEFSCFATIHSKHQFLKAGFYVVSTTKNGIFYMKRTKNSQ